MSGKSTSQMLQGVQGRRFTIVCWLGRQGVFGDLPLVEWQEFKQNRSGLS